ncbi:hypothetical protein DM01DRAFT_1379257 [Hesseltinella vesiculosa]|uniref:Uncharacterized protein n=1 Tax=Hesseltinella vesiculosa TaxID=101127 RepID=A0A1X2GWX5_9FUNG|nr:hypothetical protein DM01DRAFT_1379257 [Hesseltinella vesiculosa]
MTEPTSYPGSFAYYQQPNEQIPGATLKYTHPQQIDYNGAFVTTTSGTPLIGSSTITCALPMGPSTDTYTFSEREYPAVHEEDVQYPESIMNPGANQEAYILQLQQDLQESRTAQAQYYARIKQMMALIEKQTAHIKELQQQVVSLRSQHNSSK